MGRFAPTLSDRQRAAVVYAVLDSGLEVGGMRVAEMAARGELPGPYADLAPFTVSTRHVQQLAAAEREHRSGKGKTALSQAPPHDAAKKIVAECFDLLAADLRSVKTKKRGPERAKAIGEIAKATRDVLQLEQASEPKAASSEPATARPGRPRTRTPADEMAARIREGSNGHERLEDEGEEPHANGQEPNAVS